ncbi:MAG: Gfo/Idh/MocA family oxidoreductase [Caulobacter sp.]|nr:Gfo/Idh/MocA family oxidoreductase [Caulobacter sp.]
MSRLAVIGCGAWGRNLIRTCAELGVLGAVADADPAAASEQAAAWNVPALPLADILADPTFPAVILATPAPTHIPLAHLALDHGKDVFVEKPLALTLDEAEALAARLRGSDRIFMVGHLLRHHPAFETLLAMVRRGDIGRLHHVTASRLNLGRVRTHEDAFLSLSPHDLSMVLALAGEQPERIHAVGRTAPGRSVADETRVDLLFPSGLHAHVAASWLNPFKEQRLVVVGETGALVFDDTRPWPEKLSHRVQRVADAPDGPRAVGEDPRLVPLEPEAPLTREIRAFVACCAARKRPVTDIEEGLGVQRVLEAVQKILASPGG